MGDRKTSREPGKPCSRDPLSGGDRTWPRRIATAFRAVGTGVGYLAIALVLLMAIPITYDALARAAGHPTIWVFEITLYTLIAAGFLANALALRRGAHFRIELMFHLFPRRVGAFNALGMIFTLAIAIVTMWAGWGLVAYSFTNNIESDSLLSMPLYIPQFAIFLGGAALGLEAAAMLISGDYPGHAEGGE